MKADIKFVSHRFTTDEFKRWRELFEQRLGLRFDMNRMEFFKRQLLIRMSHLSYKTYDEYYQFILKENENHIEWQNLIDLLVNRESRFLRHKPSFDALMNTVLPQIARKRMNNGDSHMIHAECGMLERSGTVFFIHGIRSSIR